MIKAIFMDYYGTVTHENGPIAAEVVKRVFQTGDAESPEEVFHLGDSLESDVLCPGRAGIEGIWLNRSRMPVPGGVACMAASTFEEVERILERKQEGER